MWKLFSWPQKLGSTIGGARIFGGVQRSSEEFGGVRRSSEEFGGQFGGVRRSSEELGDLIRGSSEVFGGVRRTSEGLGKCPKNALGLQKYTLNFNGPKRIVIDYFTIF